MESFDIKSWVHGGTKIRPGIPSNWRIFESYWHDNKSQIDNLTHIIWLKYSPITRNTGEYELNFFEELYFSEKTKKIIE